MVCRASETGDWRESIRECRKPLEKFTEGWAKSERSRGIQRCFVCYVSSVREAQKQRQNTGVVGVELADMLVSVNLKVEDLIPHVLTQYTFGGNGLQNLQNFNFLTYL